MSYMTYAKKYEDEVIEGIKNSTDDSAWIPPYGRESKIHLDGLLCESIEAMIMRSEAHVGSELHYIATAFADYLHEQYGVEDVDCEFLTMYVNRLIFIVGTWAHELYADKMGEYIDWDRYFADHPEEKEDVEKEP